jgi:putative DNA primase/helicase
MSTDFTGYEEIKARHTTGKGFTEHRGGGSVDLVSAASLTPRAIAWLWKHWLARGKFEVIAGVPGSGKTTISLDFAAQLTAGGIWPDGARAPIGDVVIWSGEDDIEDTLLPRFLASGGDCKRLYFAASMNDEAGKRPFDPSRDMGALLKQAEALPSLAMAVIDPVVFAVAGDSHKNAETRRSLGPLISFAETRNCVVLGVTHFAKNGSGRDPLERISGSLAFGAAPRLAMVTVKPADLKSKKRLVRAKSNIGPEGDGFEYALVQEPLTGYDFGAQRAVWGDPLYGSARDLLAEVEGEEPGRPPKARDMAADFLRALLVNGPVPVKTVEKSAAEAGLSWGTVRRAADGLGIVAQKVGLRDGWEWRLP